MLDLVPFRRHGGVPDMFREMERMFDEVRRGFPFHEMITTESDVEWAPRVDIDETDKAIEVKAELPGLESKDIHISLDRDMLVIKGERKRETEESGKFYHRIERQFGSFCRSLRLPVEVESEKIDATFKNGVLQITLPKTEEAKKRIAHIKIH